MAPDILQDVLAGQDPALSPVNQTTPPAPLLPAGVPIMPAPAANTDLTNTSAPDIGSATLGAQLAAKGSPFLRALTQGADAAAAAQPKAPNGQPAPGAWARSLVAGTQSALSGVAASLGDAAAVGTVPPGSGKVGGALTGITRTLNARNQRMTDEQNQKVATARANVEMRHQQLLNVQLSKAANDADTVTGVNGLAAMTTLPVPLDTVGTDMLAADMTAAMHKGDINASEYSAFHTGNRLIDHDANGDPVYQPTYTVVKLPDQVSLKDTSGDPAQADKLKAAADFIQQYTGKDLHGSTITGATFNQLWQSATSAQTAQAARDDAAEKLGLEKAKQSDAIAFRRITPAFNNALAHLPVNTPGRTDLAIQALSNTVDPDGNGKQTYGQTTPSLREIIRTEGAYGKILDEENIQAQKSAEKGKNSIQALVNGDGSVIDSPDKALAVKSQVDATLLLHPNDPDALNAQRQINTYLASQKKNKADVAGAETTARNEANQKDTGITPANENLSGTEFLATLPKGQAAFVQAIGEGRQTISERSLTDPKTGLATPTMQQLSLAYPGYDKSKGATWAKTRNEYMGSGTTAKLVVPAYNTALEHMQDLYNNTTLEGIANPASTAYQNREVALGYVTREVGKAISAGSLTQKEGDDMLAKLGGGLTPGLKRDRIVETAKLLHDKIDEYQQKFQAASPAPSIIAPTLISPKAQQSLDFVLSGAPPQEAKGAAPTPAPKPKQNPFRPQVNQ